MICKGCQQYVPRIKSEPRKGARGHLYRDALGKIWHGYLCATCWGKRVRSTQGAEFKGIRIKRKTSRRCRVCAKILGPDRYFTHALCSKSETPYGEYEYGGYCAVGSGF